MLHDNKFEAAKGIRIIMDDDKVICKENGCQIMYVFLCLFRIYTGYSLQAKYVQKVYLWFFIDISLEK